MKRSRKVITASVILFIGLLLSWPFRHEGDSQSSQKKLPEDTIRAVNGDPIALASPTTISGSGKVEVPVAPDHVVARMASTKETSEPASPKQGTESFDVANHPALQNDIQFSDPSDPTPEVEMKPRDTRPAYNHVQPVNQAELTGDWPEEVLHVVRNGDTLEGLAERYLGDAGRGLEIFDLNRDQLSNPYLLPIGVELRIPRQEMRSID